MSVIRKLLSGIFTKRNIMSEKHLSAVCPFAKRVRLVLKAKNLPHDIVNINLQDKPEWYFKIHPKAELILAAGLEVVQSYEELRIVLLLSQQVQRLAASRERGVEAPAPPLVPLDDKVQRLAASRERGVEAPAPPLVPLDDKVEPASPLVAPPDPLEGGSDSGRLGIWGSGRLCSRASGKNPLFKN
ncbi:hypothetical protein HUJ04_003380 [Dendroctonus ponderosae]|nr:hypothetical protein HUJ04_003380 [Dendroctonus ponderosae]